MSLITGRALPDVTSPPGYRRVAGWADYIAALEQQDVYSVCHQTNVGRWRCIDGVMNDPLTRKATVLGTGFTWSRQEKTQNAYICWRANDSKSPAVSWSGSPLCLGRPSDATSKAVVFQNFEREFLIGENVHASAPNRGLIRAGFVLPVEIRDSEILEGGNQYR